METVLIILLTLVILSAITMAIIFISRVRTTREKLRKLTVMVQEMISRTEYQDGDLPGSKASGLDVALEKLEKELNILEPRLSSEKEKLEAILSTVSAGVIILDSDRNVMVINRNAADLFRANTETAGRPFINLVRDHEMDTIVQRCMETHQQQAGTVQVTWGRQYLELQATPISDGALVLIHDLTNIRRLEKIRQDFIANVSHELRTPIASCKAIVETLQNGALNDRKVTKDFLQRMHVETDKLAQMVNELAELSRIESGERTLTLEPVDIAGVVSRVTDRLKAQADRAHISIDLNLPHNLPRVRGDTDMIEQVLVNLIHNAIKFTPEKGTITVSSDVRDEMVLISIHDTGIGIPEDDLPHIFERFYKVDKARSGGGTGLGLAIAKHIVQVHGGNIWAESKDGRGSTFTFYLPVASS